MEPLNNPSFVAALDDTDEPADVIDVLALGPFVAGSQPAARSTYLRRVRPAAPLLPPGVHVTREAESDGRRAALAEGDGWTLRCVRWRNGSADVTVVARTAELAREILEQATADAVEPVVDSDETVAMEFWHRQCGKPWRASRNIAISTWHDIEGNYSALAAKAFGQLMAVDASSVAGRLVLLHGPPARARRPQSAPSLTHGAIGVGSRSSSIPSCSTAIPDT